MQQNQHGFTLPELFVATGLIVIMVIIAVSALRPVSYDAEMKSAQRHTDVAQLAQALQRYKTAHGQFPAGIPAKNTAIGSGETEYALCPVLVPEYSKDIPIDPEKGVKYKLGEQTEPEEPCDKENMQYSADYSLRKDDEGAVTISAPSAKNEKIEITVR